MNFSTIKADAVGQQLESSIIWKGSAIQDATGVAVAFRKKISFAAPPVHATLHLFADARYLLWVNGKYVERGPARFQPNGPEYDSVNLDSKLQAAWTPFIRPLVMRQFPVVSVCCFAATQGSGGRRA